MVSFRFTKALIKSVAALSYVEAQARMDDASMTDTLTEARATRLSRRHRWRSRAAPSAHV